jgi:CBS domain containing-hemolysin-like protein
MSNLFTRDSAVVALTAAADYSAGRGKAVTISGDTATLSASATVVAPGIILEGAESGGTVTVAILGAVGGTVMAKLSGSVTKGARMQQSTDGTWVTDAATGSRVISLIALETGVSGDLIEAATLTPVTLS